MVSVISEIPIQEDSNDFIAWMDWRGPDVLRFFDEGKVDAIYWGITSTDRFEQVKLAKRGPGPKRILCVTGRHPDNEE